LIGAKCKISAKHKLVALSYIVDTAACCPDFIDPCAFQQLATEPAQSQLSAQIVQAQSPVLVNELAPAAAERPEAAVIAVVQVNSVLISQRS
jgi:hypothetical protein